MSFLFHSHIAALPFHVYTSHRSNSWCFVLPFHRFFLVQGEIATLALLATIRTVLKRLVNSVRKLHDMCVQRFPEVTFKPFQNKVRFHETIAQNGIVEHGRCHAISAVTTVCVLCSVPVLSPAVFCS